MDTRKATMTLNIPAAEMAFVEARAEECDMSKTAVVRHALAVYQLICHRLKQGETMHFSGDKERAMLFIGPGWPVALPYPHDQQQQG